MDRRYEVRCDNCRYWKSDDSTNTKGGCHRYPPARITDFAPHTYFVHTITNSNGWCGEFVERSNNPGG